MTIQFFPEPMEANKPGDSFYIRAGFYRNTDFGNGQLKGKTIFCLWTTTIAIGSLDNGEPGIWILMEIRLCVDLFLK